jgi:lipopolysaccharide export system protein LptC
MHDVTARMLLDDGPAIMVAENGTYDFGRQEVTVPGPVNIQTADGYRMVTQGAAINLDSRSLTSHGKVEGRVPAGTFSADHFYANLDTREIRLDGHARLRMVPGKLTMPGQMLKVRQPGATPASQTINPMQVSKP